MMVCAESQSFQVTSALGRTIGSGRGGVVGVEATGNHREEGKEEGLWKSRLWKIVACCGACVTTNL